MVKKLISCLLVIVLFLSVVGQAQAASPTPKAVGIDVSSHQGLIDWDETSKHIDFAILRCGFGRDVVGQDDTQWYNNVRACTRLNIPFGVYLYSYALTEESIRSEANHIVRLLSGYSPSLPVYLDLEYAEISRKCTKEQILKNVTIFCDIIRAAGYTPGVYANTTWWENVLTSPAYDQWERWVAQYSSHLNYGRPYSMWQYSDKGTVKGIHGPVDMNYWYGESFISGCAHDYSSYVLLDSGCSAGESRYYYCYRCGNRFEDIETECVSSRFVDTPRHPDWAHRGIDYAIDEQLFLGVNEKCFDPNGAMTRAMAVTILWRENGCYQAETKCNFVDVEEDAWYYDAVAWAAERGIVNGVGEGRFNPMGKVTREQFATMLHRRRAYGSWGDVPENILQKFPDKDAVSDYAVEELAWVVYQGYITGTIVDDVLILDPQGYVTRAQAATILYRLPR